MKNIERPEVQGVILSIMLGKLTTYNGIKGLIKLGFYTEIVMEGDFYSYIFSDLKKWFNSEYVEPHKWKPWELEAMKHIDKRFDNIDRDKYYWVHDSKNDDFRRSIVEFPSIKEEETVNIDEELERNGMHR